MNKKISKTFYFLTIIFAVVFFNCNRAFAIKIGLLEDTQKTYIAVSQQGALIDGSTNQTVLKIYPMKKYYIKKYSNGIAISINDKYYDLGTRYLVVKTEENAFVSAKNRWYRGELIVISTGKGLTIINNVGLENYIMGVVPSEMPSSWNFEAHKAQAIAARSYALANLGKRGSLGYDLKDTPEDQAYGGASSETQKTNSAVMNTKGEVLVYANKIIPAYYHASAGGHTISSGKVWNKDLPFIRPVPSFDEYKPKFGHGVGMSQYGANTLASYGYNAYQILNYFYKDIRLGTVNSKL